MGSETRERAEDSDILVDQNVVKFHTTREESPALENVGRTSVITLRRIDLKIS